MALQLFDNRPVTTPLPFSSGNSKTIKAVLNGAELASMSDYVVNVRLRNLGTQEFHVEREATIEDEATNAVSCELEQYETVEPGSYGLQFIVVNNTTGGESKYPGDGWYNIHITGPTEEEVATDLQNAIRYGKAAADARDAILRVLGGGIAVVEEDSDSLTILMFSPGSAEESTVETVKNKNKHSYPTVKLTIDDELGQ